MEISQYEVGQIPLANLSMTVKDSYGRNLNCSVYTDISVRMLDSDNREVDLTGAVLNRGGAASGRFVFEWPRNRSLFTKRGDYVLQLVLKTSNAVDMTTAHTIRVRELGKVAK
jgi:hypothetical protein